MAAGTVEVELMPRYANRKDSNHAAIVRTLRGIGAFVVDLASLGDGCPDLLVCFRGRTYLADVKNLQTAYGRHGLSDSQLTWSERARACDVPVYVFSSEEDALEQLGAIGAHSPREKGNHE